MKISNITILSTDLTNNTAKTSFTISEATENVNVYLKINDEEYVEIFLNKTNEVLEYTVNVSRGVNNLFLKATDSTTEYISEPIQVLLKETPSIENLECSYSDSTGKYILNFAFNGDINFKYNIYLKLDTNDYMEVLSNQISGDKTIEQTSTMGNHTCILKVSDGYDDYTFSPFQFEITNHKPILSKVLVTDITNSGEAYIYYSTKDIEPSTLTHKLIIGTTETVITPTKVDNFYSYRITGLSEGTSNCKISISDGIDTISSDIFSIEVFSDTANKKELLRRAKVRYDSAYQQLRDIIVSVTSDLKYDYDIENALIAKAQDNYKIEYSNFNKISQQSIDAIGNNKVTVTKKELQSEIKDVDNAVNSLENTMWGVFQDGVLDQTERDTLSSSLDLVTKEKSDIDKGYQTLYNNEDLIDPSKTKLQTNYNNFIKAHNSLVTTINNIINKEGIINNTDKTNIDTAFENWRTALGNYRVASLEAIDSIAKKKADNSADVVDKKWAEIVLDPETGIKTQVGSLQTKITGADGIEERLETTNSKVSSIETNLNGITQRVSSTETTTATLTNKVNTVEGTANSAQSTANSANSSATNALNKANDANTLANSKAKVFTSTPTVPYQVGDLWVQGTNGDVMKCKTARTSGSYTASDWEKASKYTDDTKANVVDGKVTNLQTEYNKTKSQVAEIVTDLNGITQRVSSTESTTATLTNKVNTVEGTANTANSTADSAKTTATNAQNQANTNKGNITTLQNTVATTNNKVASIETNLNGITQRVSSTESTLTTTTNKIDNLQIGGRNLLLAVNIKQGNLSGTEGTEITGANNFFRTKNYIGVSGNTDYHIKINKPSGANCKVEKIICYTDNGTYIKQIILNTTSSVITTPSNCTFIKAVFIIDGGVEDTLVNLFRIKLEKGNRPTDWTPAPEDIDGAINSVDGKVTTLQGEYNTTKSKVATLETNLDGITQRVSSTESTTSSLTTKVNNAQNTANSAASKADTAQSTANTAKTTATNAQNQANTNKGNITTLQNTVTTTNNKVASLETNLNSITSRVSATETTANTLTTKVDNMKIGGRNLIRKADVGQNNSTATFNESTKTWTIKASAGAGGTWGCGLVLRNRNILVPYGKSYVLSFEIKVPRNCSWNIDVNNYAITGSSWAGNDNDNISKRSTSSNSLIANQWIKCWAKWENTNANNSNKVDLYDNSNFGVVMQNETSDMTYEIRNIQGELGNMPTEYTPAPEDVDSAITAVDNKVNSANTNISNLTTRVSTAESKLTKNSLTTTIGNHYTTSTDVNGIVTSKGYQTASQVQQTVNGLEAKFTQSGGYNLLLNSNFARGLEHWTLGDIASNKVKIQTNNNGCPINPIEVLLEGTLGSSSGCVSQSFDWSSNEPLTMSWYQWTSSNGTDGSNVYRGIQVTITYTDGSNSWHTSGGQTDLSVWQKRTMVITPTSGKRISWISVEMWARDTSKQIVYTSLMLEKGTIATNWTPNPNEMHDGIITLDKDGVKVEMQDGEGSQGYSLMSYDGFSIFDSNNNRIAWFGQDDTSYIDTLYTNNVKCNRLVKLQPGRPQQFYVNANPPSGSDGSGTSVSNACRSITEMFRKIKSTYGQYSNWQDITINVAEGSYYETVEILGFMGCGKIYVNINANAKLYGFWKIYDNTMKVIIDGERTGGNNANNGAQFFLTDESITTLIHVRNSVCMVKNIRSINKCRPNSSGDKYGCSFIHVEAGRAMMINCDVSRYLYAMQATECSIGNVAGSRGYAYTSCFAKYGSHIITSGYPNEVKASWSSWGGHVEINGSKYASLYDSNYESSSSTTPSKPSTSATVFSQSFTLENLKSIPEGSGSPTSKRSGVIGQGKWGGYKPHRGWGDIPSSLVDFCKNSTNISMTITMTRQNTNHGYAGAVPSPKFVYSGGTWDSNTKFARGDTKTITLPSTIVNAIANGSMTSIQLYAGYSTNDYSFYQNITITVRLTKNI